MRGILSTQWIPLNHTGLLALKLMKYWPELTHREAFERGEKERSVLSFKLFSSFHSRQDSKRAISIKINYFNNKYRKWESQWKRLEGGRPGRRDPGFQHPGPNEEPLSPKAWSFFLMGEVKETYQMRFYSPLGKFKVPWGTIKSSLQTAVWYDKLSSTSALRHTCNLLSPKWAWERVGERTGRGVGIN